MEFDIDVDGMSCAGCEHVLQTEISGIEGVSRAEPDADAGTVHVVAEEGLRDRIEQAIAETGYSVA